VEKTLDETVAKLIPRSAVTTASFNVRYVSTRLDRPPTIIYELVPLRATACPKRSLKLVAAVTFESTVKPL
jgi:hypothetical protein